MANRRTPAPIIAAILLLLPVLYVGSYLALVVPGGAKLVGISETGLFRVSHYRVGGAWVQAVFWPLEQIDRRLRPEAWYKEPPPVTFDADRANG